MRVTGTAHLLQFSGAIWYPMVYELPAAAKRAFGRQKRERQFDRTLRYVNELGASWVFPIAGPPCFLDEELWGVNDLFGDEGNIFPDQQDFIEHYERLGHRNGVVLLPGTTATVTPDACEVEQPVPDVAAFFAGKEEYLRAYQRRQRPVIEAARASWRHPEVDVLAGLTERVQPLMARSEHIARGIGGPVRFDLTDDAGVVVQSIVFDFTAREVRTAGDERARYRFRTRRSLIEHLLATGEADWVNSLFLSCRFSAARVGQYNEYVYTFFKCLSDDRLQYAEGWYAEQTTDVEDIVIGDWAVQGLCPHLKANLARFGKLDDTVLTCQMHGWKFDLPTGRCVTSAGHPIRARRVDAPQPAG